MKKFFLIALLALFFVGCQQATNTEKETAAAEESTAIQTTDGVRYVKNSCWKSCSISYLTAKASSRAAGEEISASDLEKIVETINEETNDDQLVVLPEDIPIEESPLVDVYIVNEGDYVVLAEYIGLDRSDFISRRADFDIDARGFGGILFVDKIPPVPVVIPDTRTRHEKYSIYMVNKYDKIVVYQGFKYEKHIDELWDSLTPEIQAGYDNNIDKLMDWYIFAFNSESVCQTYEDAPWRVVSGQIYTEPTE